MEEQNAINVKEQSMELGYRLMFDGMAGNSEWMEKFFSRRFKDWDYYDFPEYTVAINNGKVSEKFKGDRLICAKDGSYHFMFRKRDGFTAKWGKKKENDPPYCPWGNEIADIEVTTACSGIRDKKGERKPCAFCLTANVEITMSDGSRKRIDEIQAGDKVLSYHDGNLVENTVEEVYCREYDGKVVDGFANYVDRRVEPGYHALPSMTLEHPMMVKLNGKYEQVPAGELKYHVESEVLFDDNSDGYIYSTELTNYMGAVFNFHCVPDEMYFADGVLVHNCYKSNSSSGSYMPFDTFRTIFDKMNQPRTMTQIAFGVDAECKTNPDIWKIMDYALENGVVPNVTVADIDKDTAKNIVKRCGACAVSCYERDKNRCYDSIAMLTAEARTQGRPEFKVNMHLLVSHQTEQFVFEVLDDILHDGRLAGLNAVVFLSLKQKGRGKAFSKMDDEVYARVIQFVNDHGISYGSDSCGANRLMKSLKEYYDGRENGAEMYERALGCVESCESEMYSQYVNVQGFMYPCSFMENEGEWKEGIDLKDARYTDYTSQIWNHERVKAWREQAVKCMECNGCNKCPYYNI